ncbi:MAG: hypothetical protein ACJ75L_05150 [Gaiellaceae bacterium]
MADEQARRVGLNEALFREVNEQIRSLSDEFSTDDGSITVVCECGDADCIERLEVQLSDYERVRADSLLFLVAQGHVFPNVERVVESADGHEVVQKQAGPAVELSQETDPRS